MRLAGKICCCCKAMLPSPHVPGERLCARCLVERSPRKRVCMHFMLRAGWYPHALSVCNAGGGSGLSAGYRAFYNQHLQPFRSSIDTSRHAWLRVHLPYDDYSPVHVRLRSRNKELVAMNFVNLSKPPSFQRDAKEIRWPSEISLITSVRELPPRSWKSLIMCIWS